MTIGRTVIAFAAAIGLAAVAQASDSCKYQGASFSDGATTCQAGTQFRCDDGDWKSLAVACPSKEEPRCDFNGSSFSAGSASCQSGVQYRCDGGSWKSLNVACSPDQIAAPRVAPPQPLRTCMLEGSTVSHASTVCKSGTMYECDDGDWRNLGTPCK